MSSNTTVTVTVAQLEALADRPPDGGEILVRDGAAAISADLALRGSSSILALLPLIGEIVVADGGTVTLTAAQALTGGVNDDAHSALALTHGGDFAITGASVAQLGHLERLPVAPAHIGIEDGAAAVLDNIETLARARGHVRVTLTDTWLEAAQVPPLTRLGGRLANGVAVRDTGIALANLVDSEDAAAIAYLNVHGAVLRADSTVTVADIAALARLTNFRTDGHHLTVWDNAARLTETGAAEALASGLAAAVFLRAPGGTATVTASCAAALFSIAGFSAANPDGSANQVIVADSAAEIAAVRRQLAAVGSDISRIEVISSGTIGAATLRHLQALGATAAVGVLLTVRDSAAAIAASEAAPGQTLDADVWRLSSSAIVSMQEALALARRPYFSPAPYTLTLASDAVVSAADARALSTLAEGFSSGGHRITVRDSAANLAAAAHAGAWDVATSLTLAGPETVRAAVAETLLGAPKFVLTSSLTITDTAANLLRAGLRAVLAASPYRADIHTMLSGPEALSAEDAGLLAAVPNFADPGHLVTVAPVEKPAGQSRPQVILGAAHGDDARPTAPLVESTLTRAGAAPREAVALRAIADLSAQIADGDAAIPLAAEALAGNASEFASLRADAVPPREHIVASVLAQSGVAGSHDLAEAADGALVNIYSEAGLLLSATLEQQEGFVVTAPDAGGGRAFSVTESIGGRESPPVVVLDANTLQNAVSAAHAQFADSGAIEVRTGQYLDLYTAGSVPVLDRPALVYDPSAHTVALDIPGHAPVPLIVLGASTPPASLDVSEILVRKAG